MSWLYGAGAIYLSLLVLVAVFQRRLQYFPRRHAILPTGPDYDGLAEIELQTDDGERLLAWWQPARCNPGRSSSDRSHISFLVLHGNAGNRMDRLYWLALLETLGVGVLILDYRGYGGSTGHPTEAGLRLDADAARQWLREKQPNTQLVYVGESLGSAVAVQLAADHPPCAMLLHSAFESALDIAKQAYPFLPVRWLMRDRFDIRKAISKAECPALFIHGAGDTIVPLAFGRRLFQRAAEPRRFLEIPGAGHNDLPFVDPRRYLAEIGDFLDTQLPAHELPGSL